MKDLTTETTVYIQDGVVTLGGKSKTAAEKDLAGRFAGDMHGITRIINNMTII